MTETEAPVTPDLAKELEEEIRDASRCKCDYGGDRTCPVPCRNEMDGEDRLCRICRSLLSGELDAAKSRLGHCHLMLSGWTP